MPHIGSVKITYTEDGVEKKLGSASINNDGTLTIAKVLRAIADSLESRYQSTTEFLDAPDQLLLRWDEIEKYGREAHEYNTRAWECFAKFIARLPWFVPNALTLEDIDHNQNARVLQTQLEAEMKEIRETVKKWPSDVESVLQRRVEDIPSLSEVVKRYYGIS